MSWLPPEPGGLPAEPSGLPAEPAPAPGARTTKGADAAWLAAQFELTWAKLEGIGHGPAGGYTRPAWSEADAQLRLWFRDEAAARDMPVEQDGNGNLWAWWGRPDREALGHEELGHEALGHGGRAQAAVAVGSHLDSVPNGGAFDGPLGIVSGFLAIDLMRSAGRRPVRPMAVVCWSDEEGARFGVACVGSRLLTGALGPDAARVLVDEDGITLAQAMRQAGADPALIGRDSERLASLLAFVELHIEQGRGLVDLGAPVALASGIWPHGRWRCSFRGEPNHAGTTLLTDRHDPMLPLATTVIEARKIAEAWGARATFARVAVHPNATNAVAARVDAWLDARAPDEQTLKAMVAEVADAAVRASAHHGTNFELVNESLTAPVDFEPALRSRLDAALGGLPQLPTAAGHDAGVLSAHVPTAMLFVRNPTGTSHSPVEEASVEDCLAGVHALALVLEELVCK